MREEVLYHGAHGDAILSIIAEGAMRPNSDGRIFFAQYEYANTFMHGADIKRRAVFAVKLRVQIPREAQVHRESTRGVRDTFIVLSSSPISATVLELFVRSRPDEPVVRIQGVTEIAQYLKSRQGPTRPGPV